MKIESTHYFKGRDGYQAETLTETDANGKVWSITTYKGRGNVYCSAKQGEDSGNGAICYNLSNMMGGDNETYFSKLASEDGQCNEAKVKRVHEAGLKAFFERIAAQPEAVKPYIIEVGQIIFDSSERRTTRVIYATERAGHYKAVDLDGTRTENVSMLEKGDYTEGNIMPMEQVNELVNKAHTAERERNEAAAKREAQQAAERAQKIQEGSKIISAIPEGVQSVIVANFRVDDSDHQSDYFGAHTEKTVYLAWSEHTRDIFSELRKAAGKFEETKQYSTPPNQNREKGNKDEHREKYTGGHGYFLGESKYSGWIVEKENLGQYGPTLELLQIAAAEGRFLCNEASQATEPTTAQHEAQEVTAGTIQIIEYSPKAIAVIGDTKPIKDILGRNGLNGKFNARLTCGPGWIFPKSRLEEVQKRLSEIKGKKAEPEQVENFGDKTENFNNSTIEERLNDPLTLIGGPAEDLPEIPTAEEIEENNAEFEYEEDAEREFCKPKPVTGNGFFRESGSGIPAPKVTPQVPAPCSRHGAEQESSALKLYSEHREGVNTGRAQQISIF